MIRPLLFVALAAAVAPLTGCDGCNPPPVPPPGGGMGGAPPAADAGPADAAPPDPFQQDDLTARTCRDDLFFVEVPIAAAPPPLLATSLADVGLLLQAEARKARVGAAWFCAAPGCAADPLMKVVVEDLLPARGGDLDARFFRLWFEDSAGARVPVTEAARCDVMATLRFLLIEELGDDFNPLTLFVGRECEATGQTPSEATATPERRTWHLDALGIDPASVRLGEPNPAAPTVHVAVVDTRVDRALATNLGAEIVLPDGAVGPGACVGPEADGPPHRHAGVMGLLVRQAAPDARITFYPALGQDNRTPVGEVARALDRALHAPTLQPGEPLLINLSLGWPEELSSASPLGGPIKVGPHFDVTPGGTCATVEDPVGESVRGLLRVAYERDRTQGGLTVAFAAAGNRAGEGPRQPGTRPNWARPPAPLDYELDGCMPAGWDDGESFYPAELHRDLTCAPGTRAGGTARPTTAALGGVDRRGRISIMTPPGADIALFAPGQHVYVDADPAWPCALPATAEDPACAPGDPLPGAALQLPTALSGTSVATALTTGVAARLLGELTTPNGPPPLDRGTLIRLLYVTGRPLCGGAGVASPRQVAWDRLQQAATCPAFFDLLGCLQLPDTDARDIDGALLPGCAAALTACGLDDVPDCAAAPDPDPAAAPVDAPACLDAGDPAERLDAPACVAAPCDFEDEAVDRYTAGALGPQPDDPYCPDCSAFFRRRAADGYPLADLQLPLFAGAAPGTDLARPTLVLYGPDNRAWSVDLTRVVPEPEWVPGAAIKITDLKLPSGMTRYSNADWRRMDATLLLYVLPPGGKYYSIDKSPLDSTSTP